ncbi:helix-turn-helix domain-containing protein [Candidatus Rhabdochlamydia oedothoracis]|uniref:helix-turn-helix domain-containing protein n=1 Tax=Candidatus Rhabdochlamydia oedothoracis TaxID=2720720 RepID=UPI001C651901|nr:helix-turn-helix domain-containing protein [Candidatus Rhabdochlamydia oedothoracis]
MIFNNQTKGETLPKGYHHLTYDQRCQIYILQARGDTSSSIANILKVHHSTISRELKRNKGQRGYRHQQAQEKAFLRKNSQPNKKMTPQIVTRIEEKIKLQWSPIQISGWLKRHGKEHVSHETIYNHIWKDKRQGGQLYRELRHRGKKYNKQILSEIAKHFGLTLQAIFYALKRLKITRKKRLRFIRKGTRKQERNI